MKSLFIPIVFCASALPAQVIVTTCLPTPDVNLSVIEHPNRKPAPVFPEMFADSFGNVYRKVPCVERKGIYFDSVMWNPCECQCAERVVFPVVCNPIPVNPKPVYTTTKA